VPVTQEMLNDPEPGQWLHWRGTQNARGYNPLYQVKPEDRGPIPPVLAYQFVPPWRPQQRRGYVAGA
ncbi:MAG: hypothetical protein OXG35_13395, partial [Acidobacteria bacterium]|nr:hypothetical protein [Acidobacteriota bacterium]